MIVLFHPTIIPEDIQKELLEKGWTIVVGSTEFHSIHTFNKVDGLQFHDQSTEPNPVEFVREGVKVKTMYVKHLCILDGELLPASKKELIEQGEDKILAKLTSIPKKVV